MFSFCYFAATASMRELAKASGSSQKTPARHDVLSRHRERIPTVPKIPSIRITKPGGVGNARPSRDPMRYQVTV
jgi:hypothetical protein